MALSKKDKLLQAAQKNIQKGQWLKAARDFQKVLETDPKDVRTRQRLAELLGRAGCRDESLEAYETVAKSYADNGFYLKAIAVYKQMQKIDPSLAKVYRRLGELNEKQGLIGNALGEYRQLAELFESSDKGEELIEVLEKMKELDPENSALRLRICQACFQYGSQDKARGELQEALALLDKLGNAAAALRFKDLVQSCLPDDMPLAIEMGQVLLTCGQPEETLALLDRNTEGHPQHKVVLALRARAYRALEDYAAERQIYEGLLTEEEANLDYREGFVRACLATGDDRQALDRLEEWKAGFLEGERLATLKAFYEQLQGTCGEDDRVRQTLHDIYENTGEGSKLFDLLSGDQLQSEPSDADGAESDAPGEWFGSDLLDSGESHDFLADGAVVPESAQQNSSTDQAPGQDTWPTGDMTSLPADADDSLDLDLDGMADNVSGVASPDGEEETGIELAFDLELELDLPADDASEEDLPEASLVEELLPASGQEQDLQDGPERDGSEFDVVGAGDSGPIEAADADANLFDDSQVETASSGDDGELADFQRELGAVFEMDSFDLEDDDEPDLTSDLEEAEFYLQQDFLEDARQKCQALLETHPHCKEADEMLRQVEQRLAEKPSMPVAGSGSSQAGGTSSASRTVQENREHSRLQGNISAFRKGIEDAVAQDDSETHFDLGIAYKEMGLFDEAMEEFKKAMGHPRRFIDALTLTGVCLISKEEFEAAAELFKQGLHQEGLAESDRLNLYFELGQLYLAWGRPLDALDSFQQVADTDISYREVGDHICRLRDELGLDDGGGSGGTSGGSGSSRVSYL